MSCTSESIWRIGPGDNVIKDNSEWLHFGNVKDAYYYTDEVSYL